MQFTKNCGCLPRTSTTVHKWVRSVTVESIVLYVLSSSRRCPNLYTKDAAVENLVNVVFYIILGALVINRLGRNPLTLFFSFSSIILAFAFVSRFNFSCLLYQNCLFNWHQMRFCGTIPHCSLLLYTGLGLVYSDVREECS